MRCEIKQTYYRVQGANILLWEPLNPGERAEILVTTMHGGMGRTLEHPLMAELAKVGFRTAYCVPDAPSFIDQFPVMDKCMELLRRLDGVKKIVLMGQSRGAGVMSAYQKIAENGVQVFQGPERHLPFPDMKLRPADGLMLLDANFGFTIMHLTSLNPALTEAGQAGGVDETLNALNPANGYAPDGKSHYSEEFRHRYLAAQRQRYNRLLDQAEERWNLIQKGKGIYGVNEPMIIPDAVGVNHSAKLFASDLSIFAHTRNPWLLIHKKGTVTTEIIPSVRKNQENPAIVGTPAAALYTTVKDYLWMELKVGEDYDYGEDYLAGIDFESCFTCSSGNVKMISCPLLLMGHTAGYEYITAEWSYQNAKSPDKTIAFAEGLAHDWTTPEPEIYGNALATQADYVGEWLMEKGRFR